ncbi:DUF3244 domain-containing protein [Sunxiuqinia indica]|uniref:DUF3244 domain-containing protein n=1 Tax=Sunxiuqinia indica TaxID=2692584 RepID=UPI00135B3B0D|nr:hypothetical protein [Sunxiuqinia indica]
MKIFTKLLCVLVTTTMMSDFASARELPKIEMKAMEGKNALLEIDHANNAVLEITIQDKKGEIVYYNQQESTSDKYQHVYDLSAYQPGAYNLIVASNDLVTEHQFSVSDEVVNIGEKQLTQKPFFAFDSDNNIVRVAYLNFPGEKVKLKIYEGNDLIFNKALDDSFSVNEGLNLSKLEAGAYQIVLDAGAKDFNYPVEIR